MLIVAIRTNVYPIGLLQFFLFDCNVLPVSLAIDTSCQKRAFFTGYNMVCAQQYQNSITYLIQSYIALPCVIQKIINYQSHDYSSSHLTFPFPAFFRYSSIGCFECHAQNVFWRTVSNLGKNHCHYGFRYNFCRLCSKRQATHAIRKNGKKTPVGQFMADDIILVTFIFPGVTYGFELNRFHSLLPFEKHLR